MRASQNCMRLISWERHESKNSNWDLPLFGEDTGDYGWYYSWLIVEFDGTVRFSTYSDVYDRRFIEKQTTIHFNSYGLSLKYTQNEYDYKNDVRFKDRKVMKIMERIKVWFKNLRKIT